jgi:hypothetical protein
MSRRDANFFVVGAAIICGCFFAGQNVVYRGIYLLLALPGLLAFSHDLPDGRGRVAFRIASFAVVYVQWALFISWAIKAVGLGSIPHPGATAAYLQWFCNEVAWWWIVTVLLSVALTFVISSEQWRLLSRLLRLARGGYPDRTPIVRTLGREAATTPDTR